MTKHYLPGMETTTLASTIASIAPFPDNYRNTLSTTPHQVGTSIVKVPSPAGRNLTNFLDNDAQDDVYDSDGEIVPFFDALEEEGDQ